MSTIDKEVEEIARFITGHFGPWRFKAEDEKKRVDECWTDNIELARKIIFKIKGDVITEKPYSSPWRLVKNKDGSLNVVSCPDDEGWSHKIALVNGKDEKNARLIVASPNMLAVLQAVESWIVDYVPEGVSGRAAELRSIREAIKETQT